MSNLDFMLNLENISITIEVIKTSIIILLSYFIFAKFINIKNVQLKNILIAIISVPIISIIATLEKYKTDSYQEILIIMMLTSVINIINFKRDIIYSLLVTIISLSINYIIFVISITIAFIPEALFKIESDYISLIIIIIIYFLLTYRLLKINKIKYGISFFREKIKEPYLNILILNIGVIILFFVMMIQDEDILVGRKIVVTFVSLAIIMFITLKQSIKLYYKQNLLTKDLEQTKAELESKKQEIDKLEKENLEFSKTSHSLAHKQKALEYKLEQLMKRDIDIETKEAIKEEIQKVSKELYKEPNELKLAKTEIESIDNMFSYMQSECIKNNIKFELQVVGNIYYMINNLISENDLEILIADHLKDAIIAINNSDNSNRSILVRIGKIDNVYSLHIYDSGIEFTKEVLDNIGKKPITTYADNGGTGMGFMNTFDTLNKTKASLIINEIGKPCEDNYTKVLIFKFDNQNEFEVNSYKKEAVV